LALVGKWGNKPGFTLKILDTFHQKGQKPQIILIKFGERDEVLKCAEIPLRIVSARYIILWRLVCEKMSNQTSFCKGVSTYGFSSDKRTADAPQNVPRVRRERSQASG
jgi:hypothetical protein